MLRWKSSLKPAAAAPATDYKATVLADNPLFYYRLGEASGTNAYDEVAAANNGTYYNTPDLGQTGAISGDSNTAVKFKEASSEYAQTLTLSSETSLLPCTIECFMKTDGASDSNAGILFYRSGSNTASGLNIRGSNQGSLGYHWRDQSSTWTYNPTITLSDNTWYYVALVIESTKATFYVIDESGTLTTPAVNSVSHSALDCSNAGWRIARDSNYTRYFQGWLDEIAIYDQALSQSTVEAHASKAFGTLYAVIPELDVTQDNSNTFSNNKAQKFNAADVCFSTGSDHSSAITVNRVDVQLKKTGTPTGALTCYLYEPATPTSEGVPDDRVGTADAVLSMSSISDSDYATYSFTFTGQSELAAGRWLLVVLYASDSTGVDGSNYIEWAGDSFVAGSWSMQQRTNGAPSATNDASSWTNQIDGNGAFYVKVYQAP